MPDVFLDLDTFRQGAADLFEQNARQMVGDQWEQQIRARVPDMLASAQAQADQQAQAQTQRNAAADAFEANARRMAGLNLEAAPPESPQEAPQPALAPVADQTLPEASQPTPAPAQQASAPLTPTAPVTAPLRGGSSDLVSYARDAATRAGIDPDLFQRQIQQESGFNPNAVSPAGARGIAQFMPGTARGLGVNPDDPQSALDGAARYMAQLVQQNGGDVSKALAAYNAGQGNVDKYGGVPPFEETKRYVSNILGGAGQAVAAGAQAVANAVPRDPQQIISRVAPFLGQAYAWGGKGPQQGFDCSGLAGWLTTGQPESTVTLYGKSSTVGQDQAQPGDLVFWNMGSNDMHLQHVGVYLGNGQVVQSGGNQSKVNIGSVDQAIGSPPEFRRLGPGGAPAQVADAPQQAASADAPVGPLDHLKQIGETISSAITTGLSNLFGGGSKLPSLDQSVDTATTLLPGVAPIKQTVQGFDPANPLLPGNLMQSGFGAIQQYEAGQQTQDERAHELMARGGLLGRNLSPDEKAELEDWTRNRALSVAGADMNLPGAAARTMAGLAPAGGQAMSRFFHGTGSEFPTPDAARFDPHGLFGPGYYLTSDARVAGGYGESRAASPDHIAELQGEVARWQRVLSGNAEFASPVDRARRVEQAQKVLPALQRELQDALSGAGTGPNVRPVDVPADMHLFQADGPVSVEQLRQIQAAIPVGRARDLFNKLAFYSDEATSTPLASGDDAYQALKRALGLHDEWTGGAPGHGQLIDTGTQVNRVLADAGFDGIQYQGGKRVPMPDAAGQPIEHTAVNIFPSSLDKLRNAISGTQGGQASLPFATTLGGAAAGGATAYQSSDPNDPSLPLKVAGGVLAGGALGYGAARGLERPEVQAALRTRQRAEGINPVGGFGEPPQNLRGVDPASEANPFRLHTEPAPDRVPLPPEEVATHIDYVERRFEANNQRIQELENRLQGGTLTGGKGGYSGSVVRPPWAAGYTDDALRTLAEKKGANPYEEGWWEQANFMPGTGEMREDVGQSGLRGTGQRKQSPTEVRAEIEQLYAEQEHLLAAAEHADANGGTTLYRPQPQTVAEDLPWQEPTPEYTAEHARPAQAAVPTGAGTSGRAADAGATQEGSRAPAPIGFSAVEELTPAPTAMARALRERAANILLDKFPTEVRPLLKESAATFGEFIGQRRGTISDPQALKNAADVALGTPIEQWIKTPAGRAFNQEQAIALGQTLSKVGQDYDVLLAQVRDARAAGTSTQQMEAQLAEQALQFGTLAAVRSGAAAEAGRGLRAFRQALSGENASRSEAISKAFKAIGTDPERFGQWVDEFSKIPPGDTVARYKMLQGLQEPSMWDKISAWRYASMLSSWYTHLNNASSNLVQSFARPLRTASGGYLAEAGADVRAMIEAVPEGAAAFMNTLTSGVSKERISQFENVRPRPFGDSLAGRAITFPTDLMSAADDFFRTVNYAGALRSAVVREAGGDAKRAASLLADPPANLIEEATKASRSATFQEDPGQFMNRLMQLRGTPGPGGLAIQFFLPFIRTPFNIMRQGVSATVQPVTGPVKAIAAAGRGDVHTARIEAGQTAFAWLVGGAFAAKALNGELSGDGPQDPAKRRLLESQGWQRNSIKVGDQWVSYTNFGPVAVPMAIIANGWERAQEAGRVDHSVAGGAAQGIAKSLSDASFLQQIGQTVKMLSGDDSAVSYLQNLGASTVGSLIPYGSALASAAQVMDPVQRQPTPKEEFLPALSQRIQARIPLLRENVPAAPDTLGRPQRSEPATNPVALVARAQQSQPDELLALLSRAGVAVPEPPTSASLAPGESFALEPDERERFRQFEGEYLQRVLPRYATHQGFARSAIAEQQQMLQTEIRNARQYATEKIARQIPRAELYQRIRQFDQRQEQRRVPLPVP